MSAILGSALVTAFMLRALAIDEHSVSIGFLSGSTGTLTDRAFPPETCRFEIRGIWTTLEIWRYSYLSQNKSSLSHSVKQMTKIQLDIEIAHVPFIDFSYLHELWYVRQCVDSSKVSESDISDWLWYLGMKNGTSTCDPQKRLTRNECTSKREVARFLADVVRHVGWTYVSLLYEPDYNTEASIITDVLSEWGVRINQYSVQAGKSSFPSINTSYYMVNSEWRHYVLLGNWQTVNTTFQELNAFDAPGLGPTAMKTFSLWLVWGKDVTLSRLEDEVSTIGNVAILERPACLESRKSDLDLVLKNLCYPWISHTSETTSCQHRDNKDRAISRVSRAIWDILSNESTQKFTFRLSTALWKPEGRRFQTVFEGTRYSLQLQEDELFPNTQYGLNNMQMRVTTLEWPLYVTRTNDSDGHFEYGGMCMDILREMANQLNFSYTMQEPLDGEWGRVLNGKWTGLIGDIVYHKADLIFAPVSTQEERVAFMDFTISFFTDYNVIMMRMPDKDQTRWKLLLRPLNWPVLIVIACLFPAVTFSLWFCERFSPFYDHIRRRPLFPGLHHFHECTWYMFGAMLAKCGTVLPKADSGRTIVTFWWLFIVLLVAAYCGNLMAFLTVTRERKPFNTIAGMLEQDEYIWGTNNGTYLLETLRVSRDSEYRQIWKAMEKFAIQYPWVLHPSFPEQVKRVEEGGYAFMTDSAAADITIANNCDLVKADETFMMYQYGVGLQKNSAYTRIFSEGIRAITEAGLIEMWKQRWWPKSHPCPAFLQTQARQIMFLDVQSSFYILIGGIIVSAIVCSAEVLHNKWKPIFSALKKTK